MVILMSQTTLILETLKQEIRRRGKTYADAALALGLSEASVKRLFSEKSFSLERLDILCQWLGMDIAELVQQMEYKQQQVSQMTEEQEQELVSDIKLLITAHSLFNRWTFTEIIETYRISETEGIRLLARLDRMGLIQMLPNNRVKLLISRQFHWRKQGPIQAFFEKHVQNDFFRCHFDSAGETRIFMTGMLSQHANNDIIKRMEKLAMEFNTLHREDEHLPLEQRFGSSLVLAMRPWEPKIFADVRRKPNTKVFS